MSEFDLSRLALTPIQGAGEVAMGVCHTIQSKPKEQRIAGVALTFIMLCRIHKIHPGDAISIAERMLNDTAHHTTELKGAERFMKDFIKK
jgi:hypothetical protein